MSFRFISGAVNFHGKRTIPAAESGGRWASGIAALPARLSPAGWLGRAAAGFGPYWPLRFRGAGSAPADLARFSARFSLMDLPGFLAFPDNVPSLASGQRLSGLVRGRIDFIHSGFLHLLNNRYSRPYPEIK